MSEVTISTGHPDAGRIYAEALDRVTAERDAERRRADVAVADANAADAAGNKVSELLSNRTAERDALQARLTALKPAAGGGVKVISPGYDIDWKEPVGGHAIVLGDVFGLTFSGSVYGDPETKKRSLNFPGGYGVTIYGDIPDEVRFVLHGPEVEKQAEGGGDE